MKLESYEDTLNNLIISKTDKQGEFLTKNDDFREEYMLSYMLDVETKDSASLLNIKQMENPDEYMLNIATGNVGESRPVKVNLIETFNYLIGLVVKTIKRIENVTFVEGSTLSEEHTLIVWRNVKDTDNKKLNLLLDKQLKTYDTTFDVIYVNGDNNIANILKGSDVAPLFKVRLIEEEFKRRMFEAEAE